MSEIEKDAVVDQTEAETASPPNNHVVDEPDLPYHMTWRTALGVLSLSLCWSTSTYAVVGPNSAIGNMVASFPDEAANASWIANAPLICLILLPPICGAASDRYGKKWIMIVGSGLAVIGTLVSSFAPNLSTIIGGQTLTGIGNAMQLVSVAAGMEVVPAMYRIATTSAMAVINGSLGVLGGVYIFSACVQHGLGWQWGFHVQSIISGVALLGLLFFYNPPPPRVRLEQTALELAKSIDFLGIFLLALGCAFIVTPLAWAGTTYPWNDAKVVALLVIGPIILIAFGVYEWKGRSDGVMHHDFFATRNFPIYLTYGFVDGILLYASSVFIPNQLRGVYINLPLDLANNLVAFNGSLIGGFFVFGILSTKLRKIRILLVIASVLLTLACGLLIKADFDSLPYYDGMIALVGLFTAGAEVLPVGGMALVVPSHLIGTSNTVLASFRALGGAIGIAVFTAVFNNKQQQYVPELVIPLLTQAGAPSSLVPIVLQLAFIAPAEIGELRILSGDLLQNVLQAIKEGNAHSFKYVWICITACAAACTCLSFFVVDDVSLLHGRVESALEKKTPSEKQLELGQE